MSKRKTSALRNKENPQQTQHNIVEQSKTFYINESKTIDFNQVRQKSKPRKPLELLPKTINQEKYILALMDDTTDIVVVSGPAGTGKTYLGMLAAIKAMQSGKCEKIILTRPAVPADEENHGFLPGDINQKMEPWTRPLFDILREFYTTKEIEYLVSEQIIEVTPLAFCRGRTFKKAWIVCDEMQNASPNIMKMILTRIGIDSKIIIAGDTDQTDKKLSQNGLLDLVEKLQKNSIPGLKSCSFEAKDVQRHNIIQHILKMYA